MYVVIKYADRRMGGLYKYLIRDRALIYFVKKVCKALKRAGRLV